VTIPKPAREAAGLTEGVLTLVFVERSRGEVLLTHAPTAADDVIELAAKAAKEKREAAPS
jgi:bifunctional DNA-binding transcriptional regulator/antitoxin component of YhaV-PrlF toxin-antitoxin module